MPQGRRWYTQKNSDPRLRGEARGAQKDSGRVPAVGEAVPQGCPSAESQTLINRPFLAHLSLGASVCVLLLLLGATYFPQSLGLSHQERPGTPGGLEGEGSRMPIVSPPALSQACNWIWSLRALAWGWGRIMGPQVSGSGQSLGWGEAGRAPRVACSPVPRAPSRLRAPPAPCGPWVGLPARRQGRLGVRRAWLPSKAKAAEPWR